MKKKHFSFLLLLLSGVMYSQNSTNPKIIKKDIKVDKNFSIAYTDHQNPTRRTTPEIDKTPVYYDNNFYSKDILQKIHPDSISSVEIINIPDNVSKDFKRFIYVRKKDK